MGTIKIKIQTLEEDKHICEAIKNFCRETYPEHEIKIEGESLDAVYIDLR